MAQICFHIGMHKTATTWFQRNFYPVIDDVRVVRRKRPSRIANAIEEAAAKAPNATVIVSAESLGGIITTGRKKGAGLERLIASLDMTAKIAPHRSIIVGYREQGSWLKAAFAQRAKKQFLVSWNAYVSSFSIDELRWCKHLEIIQTSCEFVFPFLYEELQQSPEILIEDLCAFLHKPVPRHVDEILHSQSNPSPRSWPGQLASRTLTAISARTRRRDRELLERRIARFDSLFPPRRLSLPFDLAEILAEDWNALLASVGEQRGRDFTQLSRTPSFQPALRA